MTTLPVDYEKRPWRWKYLFEETTVLNMWFKFGKYENGCVDISDINGDIFSHVPEDVADEIIKARNDFIEVLAKHFSNFSLGNNAKPKGEVHV